MPEIVPITDIDQWESIWTGLDADDASPVFVFKRSPICPVSHTAEREFKWFVDRLPEDSALRLVDVNVISERPVSLRIADDTGILHESPQALLLGPGRSVHWHASHSAITGGALKKAVEG